MIQINSLAIYMLEVFFGDVEISKLKTEDVLLRSLFQTGDILFSDFVGFTDKAHKEISNEQSKEFVSIFINQNYIGSTTGLLKTKQGFQVKSYLLK